MKLQVLTIVFVDIKDYTTKTNLQSRLFNERLLARFSALIKPMARVFNGTVVKSLGDAYLLTFTSPTDSLLCAMAVQDELANRGLQIPEDERFEVRFAINAGEVRLEKGDVFGEAVNVAARIEGLAEGGEIYFSESVYLMMNRSEVPAEDLGLKKLKGVQDAVQVFRVPKLKKGASYELASQAERGPSAPAWALALPYGGLGLAKIRSHLTGRAVDAEGALRLRGALSELHYNAASTARSWSLGPWYIKPLYVLVYPVAFVLSTLYFPLTGRFYKGAWARVKRMFRLFFESPAYRGRALRKVGLVLLVLGAAWWGWNQYNTAKRSQERAQALKEMMEQKDAELKKERNRFKFPWQKKE